MKPFFTEWEHTGSNRGPSACKADALNQLSYAPIFFDTSVSFWDCKDKGRTVTSKNIFEFFLKIPINDLIHPFFPKGGRNTNVIVRISFHHSVLHMPFKQYLTCLPVMLSGKILHLLVA